MRIIFCLDRHQVTGIAKTASLDVVFSWLARNTAGKIELVSLRWNTRTETHELALKVPG